MNLEKINHLLRPSTNIQVKGRRIIYLQIIVIFKLMLTRKLMSSVSNFDILLKMDINGKLIAKHYGTRDNLNFS